MNKRGALALIAVTVGGLVFQASVLPVFVDSRFKPDLLLVVMVLLALRVPHAPGAPLAWFLGLLKDVFSGLYLGLNAFSFLIIFLAIKSVAARLYAESGFVFVVTVTAATLAGTALNLLMLVMFTKNAPIIYTMLSCLFPNLLFNAFVASLAALLPLFAADGEIA